MLGGGDDHCLQGASRISQVQQYGLRAVPKKHARGVNRGLCVKHERHSLMVPHLDAIDFQASTQWQLSQWPLTLRGTQPFVQLLFIVKREIALPWPYHGML